MLPYKPVWTQSDARPTRRVTRRRRLPRTCPRCAASTVLNGTPNSAVTVVG